ncbi:MAG: hypothetical protein PHH04_01615 [Thomasclavelia sp.]|jgi:cell division protein FtsL|nr:hypothetical protein [Thomasclavelia sp.]
MKKVIKQKTGFIKFAQRFFVVCLVVFVFGIIGVKSVESSNTRTEQELQKEISDTKDEIETLKMEKQELASFTRLSNVAAAKGYVYQNDSVATTTTQTPQDTNQ